MSLNRKADVSALALEATLTLKASQASVDVVDGIVDDIKTEVLTHPTLVEIEATTVLAKETTLTLKASQASVDTVDGIVDDIKTETLTHPTLAEIEATTVLAKEATLTTIDGIVDDIKTEVLTHPTLAEIEATTVLAKEATFTHATYGLDKIKTETASILTDTADMQPRVPRVLCSMDFWGAVTEELQLTGAEQVNLALGGNVVIAGLPDGITLVRVVVMFMCRSIENTNAAANKLLGAQNIEVGFGAANFIDAIALADDLFAVALSTREMGTVIIGAIDVKATVTGNGTCTFRIDAARADVANLNFNDYQVGVRVYFTV